MYISLHNRSAFSFGSALSTPAELVRFAADEGMPAIALTDLAGLYAAVSFQQSCQQAGVKPIFGAELPVVEGASVTLLAKTLAGYGNLCRLISLHHLRESPVGLEDLREYAGDLVCLVGSWPRWEEGLAVGRDRDSVTRERLVGTAHPTAGTADSEVGRYDSGGNQLPHSFGHSSRIAHHSSLLPALRDIFPASLYVELCIHCPEDAVAARRRAQLADALDIPVAASCESRCVHREQMAMVRALASIGTLTLLDRPHPDKPEGAWHLRSSAEMDRLFARRRDALHNTRVIADQCNVLLDVHRNRFPAFQSPDGRSAMQHLRELCVAGCRRRYVDEPPLRGIGGPRPTLDEALARLGRELRVIDQVHYAEYFLVFHEINQYCRSRGIATLARGSAADSLVCYALGVSHACPFRFDLPFDRFLNPERARFSKMADIDLDLPWDRRDEVIAWVYQRWGSDRVAMIGAPNTFHGRAAVVELGKVFGLPAGEVHRVTKHLPRTSAWNLPLAVAASPEVRDVPVNEEPYRTILSMAGALEGLPRHWAMHPCGMVVAPEPLTDLVPVQRSPKGPLVAQYEMEAIETLGFVKIDLLGQAGLSVLRDAVDEIERTEGLRIDLERDVDYAEPATWEMIARGDARGVHHIESPAMTSLLQQCDARDIDCLTAIVAIIRPGAANQGKKEQFARRHQGFEPPQYAHPSLVPVLEKTYGLMVFEEHILQIAVEFAGMNLGRSDVLRRALNKENRDMIKELAGEFRQCARARGRGEPDIEAVWGLVEGFAGFMFNKAHSAEYAVEAFQGAWLKLRYPAHYLAAILSNYRGFYAHSPTLPQILYVMEALRLGARFLPPCVNRSRTRFSVEKGVPERGRAIRVPVAHIQGLSEAFLERYHRERERGVFASPEEFVERCAPGDAEMQALLDAGAFDGFGVSRPALFWRLRQRLRHAAGATLWSGGPAGGAGIMLPEAGAIGGTPAGQGGLTPPVELTSPDLWQVAQREMDLLGFPVSVDPLSFLGRDAKGRNIDWSRYMPVSELGNHRGERVSVCGMMVADRTNSTTRGEMMKFVTLGDRSGFIETILFPDTYQRFGYLTASQPILAATGIVEPFENLRGHTLRVLSVSPPIRGEPLRRDVGCCPRAT